MITRIFTLLAFMAITTNSLEARFDLAHKAYRKLGNEFAYWWNNVPNERSTYTTAHTHYHHYCPHHTSPYWGCSCWHNTYTTYTTHTLYSKKDHRVELADHANELEQLWDTRAESVAQLHQNSSWYWGASKLTGAAWLIALGAFVLSENSNRFPDHGKTAVVGVISALPALIFGVLSIESTHQADRFIPNLKETGRNNWQARDKILELDTYQATAEKIKKIAGQLGLTPERIERAYNRYQELFGI